MSNFCLENRFFLNCLKKSKFFKNLPGKIEIFRKFTWKNQNFSKMCLEKSKLFVKLPEKIEISLKFAWKNRNLFDPYPRPPRFQTRLTPLNKGSITSLFDDIISKYNLRIRSSQSSWRLLKMNKAIVCGVIYYKLIIVGLLLIGTVVINRLSFSIQDVYVIRFR